MTPRRIVERYLSEALNGSGESTDDLVASPELRQRVRGLLRAFPDLEVEPVVIVADGALVAAHVVARGTHVGLFQGVPPTGRSWEAKCTGVYRVSGGRIDDAWVTWDQLALMEQLGAVERVSTVSA